MSEANATRHATFDVLKGVLRDHLGVSEAALACAVFPDSFAVKPVGDLIA